LHKTGSLEPGASHYGFVKKVGSRTDDRRRHGVDPSSNTPFGMSDWFADGATTAEFCLTQPQNIALKPKSLTHELAATVPIGALTAWQGLFDRAKMQSGERVLIHGAAGAVGLLVVQLAHLRGAYVIATASARNAEFVKHLGADEVINYETSRFEDQVENVGIVFDSRSLDAGRGNSIVRRVRR
jgi:NADPH:quinone reductase-like Zn-dependent oxidoreductase